MSLALNFEIFGSADGSLRWAKVPWDSDTFGFPIIEIQIAAPVRPQDLEAHLPPLLSNFDASTTPVLLFCKLPIAAAALARALSKSGFYPVETMLELQLPLARFKPVIERPISGLRLRPATKDDLARLIELARGAFHTDRFHVDENLAASKADERFARWIERGVRDNDMVFCFEESRAAGNRIIGFYHVRADRQSVDLSLAAVDRSLQKLGMGLLMYQAVIAECRERGYTLAHTHVTVNNVDVLNLFTKLGFSIARPTLTLHRFKK